MKAFYRITQMHFKGGLEGKCVTVCDQCDVSRDFSNLLGFVREADSGSARCRTDVAENTTAEMSHQLTKSAEGRCGGSLAGEDGRARKSRVLGRCF